MIKIGKKERGGREGGEEREVERGTETETETERGSEGGGGKRVRDSRERETDPQAVISSLLCLDSSALQRTCDTPTTKVCLQVGVEIQCFFYYQEYKFLEIRQYSLLHLECRMFSGSLRSQSLISFSGSLLPRNGTFH